MLMAVVHKHDCILHRPPRSSVSPCPPLLCFILLALSLTHAPPQHYLHLCLMLMAVVRKHHTIHVSDTSLRAPLTCSSALHSILQYTILPMYSTNLLARHELSCLKSASPVPVGNLRSSSINQYASPLRRNHHVRRLGT